MTKTINFKICKNVQFNPVIFKELSKSHNVGIKLFQLGENKTHYQFTLIINGACDPDVNAMVTQTSEIIELLF